MTRYYQVNVFSKQPFSGNGCTVFLEAANKEQALLQNITKEMRQYESIFLEKPIENRIKARIFTMQEELDFAGHPILAAAAVATKEYGSMPSWTFELTKKKVKVVVEEQENHLIATMDQGLVDFGPIYNVDEIRKLLEETSVDVDFIDSNFPIQVASAGLPYLIVPLKKGLEAIHYKSDISDDLKALGAHFLYFFDTQRMEGRSFDNDGLSEDIATGSAAGPTAAWLYQNGAFAPEITIRQGSFLNRSSFMETSISVEQESLSVKVSAPVTFFARGQLLDQE